MSEHDELITLKAQYRIISAENVLKSKKFDDLYDWLSENYPDILEDFLYEP